MVKDRDVRSEYINSGIVRKINDKPHKISNRLLINNSDM